MDSKDADQTGRMPRLSGVFAGRTLMLLVLSCRGSYVFRHAVNSVMTLYGPRRFPKFGSVRKGKLPCDVYYTNVMYHGQTACLVVNPVTVNNFAELFNCTPVGRGLRLNDGSGQKLSVKLAGA